MELTEVLAGLLLLLGTIYYVSARLELALSDRIPRTMLQILEIMKKCYDKL